ncbi:putative Integral membrane protein [Seiridium cardinale]|uniref:Integral membrane protein n=1 Tax=Seiridium cardinale TaxID=138064 RepID=A0ABR2XNC7_9PEZI
MSSSATVHLTPEPNDLGRGPLIMGVTWAMLALSIVIVAARIHLRRRTHMLGWDDYTMLLALALQIACQGIYTKNFEGGLGKHDKDLTMAQLIEIQKWNYIAVCPNMMASVIARISAALLLIRIFGSKTWFKWYLIVFTSIQTLLAIAFVPILWTQSSPIEGLWNPAVKAQRYPATRSGNIVYLVQAMLTFSDLTYVLFPVLIVFRLQMLFRRKLGLGILMGLSLITMVVSLMKTLQVRLSTGRAGNTTSDIQYNTSLIQLWSGVEQCLVISISCVPPLHAHAKVELANLRSALSSLTKIVTRKGASSNGSFGPGKPSSSLYYDVEMQSAGRRRLHSSGDEGEFPLTAPRSAYMPEGKATGEVSGQHIRQTNEVMVSYRNAENAREIV